jgi:hypothetical protein
MTCMQRFETNGTNRQLFGSHVAAAGITSPQPQNSAACRARHECSTTLLPPETYEMIVALALKETADDFGKNNGSTKVGF